MENKKKRYLLIAVAAIIALTFLIRPTECFTFIKYVMGLFLPLIIGLVVAFVLNVPVNGFEKLFGKIFKKAKKKPSKKAIHIISFVLTVICIILVIALFATLIIPELVKTFDSIFQSIKAALPTWLAWLDGHGINTSFVRQWLGNIDLKSFIEKATQGAEVVIGSIAGVAQTTISGGVSVVLGLIIAIYAQLDRQNLARQTKKLLYAYTNNSMATYIHKAALLLKDNFSKFLSGQCIESLILGFLIFISFLIFRLPYAALLGVVTAICALVPYIGAFISCALAVLLTLLESPEKVLVCIIVYLVVQFIESQLIYPHVVGGTVGLSPLMTLVAVLIGGNLFGLAGMIFFIPFVATISDILSDSANSRLRKKAINVNTLTPSPLGTEEPDKTE